MLLPPQWNSTSLFYIVEYTWWAAFFFSSECFSLSLSLSSRIPFRLITPFNRAFIFQEKFALVIPRETRRKVFFFSPSFSSLCGFPFSNWRRKISRNRLDLQLTKIASGEIDVVTIIVMGKYWEKRCHRNWTRANRRWKSEHDACYITELLVVVFHASLSSFYIRSTTLHFSTIKFTIPRHYGNKSKVQECEVIIRSFRTMFLDRCLKMFLFCLSLIGTVFTENKHRCVSSIQ